MKVKVLLGLIIIFYLSGLVTVSASDIFVPENYTTIQQAMDNSKPGDTIIVDNGTYKENIVLNKRLSIRCNSSDCVVNAKNSDIHVFKVTADYVNISGFKITGTERFEKAGIFVGAANCKISNNTIFKNEVGIFLTNSSTNTVDNNTVSDNAFGVFLKYSNSNVLANNSVSGNNYGVTIRYSKNNVLFYNNVFDNHYGIYTAYSHNNYVYLNNFIDNDKIIFSRSTNSWDTRSPVTYNYNGSSFESYMGNYWDNYEGKDENGDGVGEKPHKKTESDNALVEPFESYNVKNRLPLVSPTPISSSDELQLVGFEAILGIVGLLVVTYLFRR